MNAPKHLCIVTIRAYPFGGGEDFCKDLLIWCTRHGYRSSWICFAEGRSLEPVAVRSEVSIAPGVKMVILPGGFERSALETELRVLKPDFATTLGMMSLQIIQICKSLNIKTFVGWHYWTDAVELNQETGNSCVIQNAAKHVKSENFDLIRREADMTYVCSYFLQQAMQTIVGITITRVVHPLPSPEKISDVKYHPRQRNAVLAFNLHPLKSGTAFERCARAFEDIKFIGCYTENASRSWDARLVKLAQEVNNVTIVKWENDTRKLLQQARLVLVTSEVDETFCRAAAECMMSGVPILASTAGNLPYLLGSCAEYVTHGKNVTEVLASMYYDESRLIKMSQASIERARHLRPQFDITMQSLLDDLAAPKKTVMFFTIWGEQGLGYQCLAYIRGLESIGVPTCVFSYCSYLREKDSDFLLQTDSTEWLHPRVYYSRHTRERVTDEELCSFVRCFKVETCVIPETCWYRVFEIADLMKNLGVRVIGVPNIEIVRADELEKHRKFDSLWANNQFCLDTLAERNLQCTYVGFSPMHISSSLSIARLRDDTKVRYLIVCGWNGLRKGLDFVVESFCNAFKKNSRISLTVTAQAESSIAFYGNRSNWMNHEAINLIVRDLTHEQVLNLYATHHAVVVVSHNEGLGLSLYEPLAMNTPVITLNCRPHNEVIQHEKNGFLVNVKRQQAIDVNPQAIVSANIVDEIELENEFLRLAAWSSSRWDEMQRHLVEYTAPRFAQDKFARVLKNALVSCQNSNQNSNQTCCFENVCSNKIQTMTSIVSVSRSTEKNEQKHTTCTNFAENRTPHHCSARRKYLKALASFRKQIQHHKAFL